MTGSQPGHTLVDLRQERRPALLRAFVRLYDRTFLDPAQREDPSAWPERLWNPGPDDPVTHLLVAPPDSPGGEPAGGLLFEYYPRSGCGLLAYLAVDPRHRRQGLARLLVDRAGAILEQDAADRGAVLHAMLAEVEDPTLVPSQRSAMPPRERLAAFARLGAAWVELPYVQPGLIPGGARARHLMLLAFPVGRRAPGLDRETLRGFLAEYYRTLGVEDPWTDPDWIRMSRSLDAGARLRSLAER